MNKVYVGNLPYDVNEDDIKAFFGSAGESVEDDGVILIKDRNTGRMKGFGFLTFTTKEAMEEGLKLDGQELKGRALRINVAQAQTRRD